jgi:hypothetical protein
LLFASQTAALDIAILESLQRDASAPLAIRADGEGACGQPGGRRDVA